MVFKTQKSMFKLSMRVPWVIYTIVTCSQYVLRNQVNNDNLNEWKDTILTNQYNAKTQTA
jgi:hypothetical protein